jgi:hypothetical protein
MPYELKRLPLSEFKIMFQYWMKMRSLQEGHDSSSDEPKDGTVYE